VLAFLRAALGACAVAGTSAGVAGAAHRYVTTSPRFGVTRVQVIGGVRRTEATVAAESGVVPGTNVFTLDLDAVRACILTDPWIADAALTRRLPGTVVVHVTERRPAALVAMGDLLVADENGAPFKRFEAGDPVELPLITGLTSSDVATARDDAERTIRRGIELAAEYQRSPLARRAAIQEVHVDERGGFDLVVGRPTTALALGRPPFRRKLDEASQALAELDRRGAKAEVVFLDNEVRPERVVVRLRE
jgi:cell division protein FtsQ